MDSEIDLCLAWVGREQKAAANYAHIGAHFTQIIAFSIVSIWGEKGNRHQIWLSGDRRPRRRFHFMETCCASIYIFVTSYLPLNVANAPPVAGYLR